MTESDRPVTIGGEEPVSLEAAKQSLRFVSTEEDDLIEGLIATARAYFEEQTGRQLINGTWEYARDTVPTERTLELPRPPLYGSVEILYDDVDGVEQTFDEDKYTVTRSFVSSGAIDPYCAPGRIALVDGESWPVISGALDSFRVRRTCGYGSDPDQIPQIIKTSLCLLIGHFHRNRSEVQDASRSGGFDRLPLGADELIKVFKYTARPRLRIATGTISSTTLGY
jgi:uncharacterized phiE125 gp8 family phage protein